MTHYFQAVTQCSVIKNVLGFVLTSGILLVSALFQEGLAQTHSDQFNSQELIRQQERERQLREQFEPAPDVHLQRPSSSTQEHLPQNETPCFEIRQIILKDETELFQWALLAANLSDDSATGRCLGSKGISLVMKRIQDAIIAQGFITTRVLAEPQDLNSGLLTLTVILGRIRAIRIKEGSDHQASLWNALPAQPGDILNLRDIEQALENLKRVPTAEADIQIEPGEQPGESDLVITWKQAFPLRLTIGVDDSGAKSTGKYLGNITVSGDHLLRLNDLFYVNSNHDLGGGDAGRRGTKGYSIHYSIPYEYWLLSLSSNQNRYHQTVAGAYQSYVYSGTSHNHDVKLSRLIYRDAVRKTSVSVKGYLKLSDNFIDDTEVEVQRRRMAGWEFGLSHKEFMGAATLDVNLTLRRGTRAFNALPAPEEQFDEGTAKPRFTTADIQFNWPFKIGEQNLRYLGSFRRQWNQTPLIFQDRFSIGNRYTIRSFDGERTLSAERGWFLRNDFGFMLGQSGQELYLGIDTGRVSGPSSDWLVGKSLTGGAVGLRGNVWRVNYDVFIGWPIKRPEYFNTANRTAGFSLSIQY